MEFFKASVQYGDWEGAAAADGAHLISVEEYLEKKGLTKPNEFLIATSLYIEENSVFARAFLFNGHRDFDSVQNSLAVIKGPIPVRVVEIPLKLEEFVGLFKRFDVMLTWRGLQLEGREYSIIEQ
jgi:hypothetical protein